MRTDVINNNKGNGTNNVIYEKVNDIIQQLFYNEKEFSKAYIQYPIDSKLPKSITFDLSFFGSKLDGPVEQLQLFGYNVA